MKLIVDIPEGELAEAVAAWRDGGNYTLEVTQDAPGEFTASAAMESETAPEAAAEPAAEAPEEVEPTAPSNPAIRNVIKKGMAAKAA